MNVDYEYIVVGSGPSGAMAAQTLAEAGKQVALADVGVIGADYESVMPEAPYLETRRGDFNQHKFFLGESFEALEWDDIKVGAQLTPARKHLIEKVKELTPMVSENFFPMESMAYGGLGGGWGLGSYVYSDIELKKAGLNPQRMKTGYQTVCDRIGISAGRDDLSPHILGDLQNTLPPLQVDNSAEKLYAAYRRNRAAWMKRGVYLGHPALALLSQPFNGRQATRYRDMDFYSDRERAAYRPWITVNALRQRPNFTYLPNLLVLKFAENESSVVVETVHVGAMERKRLTCRVLVLAAGVLGSGRIVLRSFKGEVERLPILCNPYSHLACLHLRMLGTPLSAEKTSASQALLLYDENNTGENIVSTAVYTYRSLLLHKLVKETPLNFADGTRIMDRLQSALMIVGIHHPDAASERKYIQLIPKTDSPTEDALFAHYEPTETETREIARNEKIVRRIYATLGCYPIQSAHPGFGGSIHYAGALPFSSSGARGTTSPNGRLNGTRHVFAADGCGFNHLPAKGITLTLMANAHLTALEALHHGG